MGLSSVRSSTTRTVASLSCVWGGGMGRGRRKKERERKREGNGVGRRGKKRNRKRKKEGERGKTLVRERCSPHSMLSSSSIPPHLTFFPLPIFIRKYFK